MTNKRHSMYSRSQRHSHVGLFVLVAIVVGALIAGYTLYTLKRPLAPLMPRQATVQLQTSTGESQLRWPATGQSAVAVLGTDILNTYGEQTSVPIASTAKVITALMVLQKKPLTVGQQGPLLTLHDDDVALYNSYTAQEGSVVPVTSGEQISEYQMLQAMMLPSANNMADSLAIWAYGSLDAYAAAAQSYVQSLGLTNTHVGSDASGFSPTTTSTARDLVILGSHAMQNPVLAQVVGQQTADDIPGTTIVHNVNALLGIDNIVGIKTGNTDQAGGVYLAAATTEKNGKPFTIITANVGAASLYEALQNSLPLITSGQANLTTASLLSNQTVVGEYRQPWGPPLSAAAKTALTSDAWRGSTAHATVKLDPIPANAQAGQVVGSATSTKTPLSSSQTTAIILQSGATKPSIWWRLLHP